MKYLIETGEQLEAASLRQLVEILWLTKWNPEPTLEEDLIRIGVVTPMEE